MSGFTDCRKPRAALTLGDSIAHYGRSRTSVSGSYSSLRSGSSDGRRVVSKTRVPHDAPGRSRGLLILPPLIHPCEADRPQVGYLRIKVRTIQKKIGLGKIRNTFMSRANLRGKTIS